jgi:hypothetical protein
MERYAVELILLGIVLLGIYVRTFIKSTVENSIAHQFDVKLEQFKQSFTRELHAVDRKDKYVLAALDKRLEVHQQAFAFAVEMIRNVHFETSARQDLEGKLDTFWINNCLYLSATIQKQFKIGMNYFSTYEMLLRSFKLTSSDKKEQRLQEMFDHIYNLPEVIAKAIDLELMGNDAFLQAGKKINALGIEDVKEEL